jgi:hypothetical protein
MAAVGQEMFPVETAALAAAVTYHLALLVHPLEEQPHQVKVMLAVQQFQLVTPAGQLAAVAVLALALLVLMELITTPVMCLHSDH